MELMETNVMSELARTKDDLSTTLVENEVLEAQIDNLQTMNKQIKTCFTVCLTKGSYYYYL